MCPPETQAAEVRSLAETCLSLGALSEDGENRGQAPPYSVNFRRTSVSFYHVKFSKFVRTFRDFTKFRLFLEFAAIFACLGGRIDSPLWKLLKSATSLVSTIQRSVTLQCCKLKGTPTYVVDTVTVSNEDKRNGNKRFLLQRQMS